MEGSLKPATSPPSSSLLSLFYEPIDKPQRPQPDDPTPAAPPATACSKSSTPKTSRTPPRRASLPAPLRAHVRFERVSFAYGDQPTLHDVDLEARPGQTIALVGSTGAGKSTVLSLLTRFYESTIPAGSPSTASTSPPSPRTPSANNSATSPRSPSSSTAPSARTSASPNATPATPNSGPRSKPPTPPASSAISPGSSTPTSASEA
jgi:hypothetical protein